MQSFLNIKPSPNGKISLLHTGAGKSGPTSSPDILARQIQCMPFTAIHENIILVKISEFTVIHTNDCERINHRSLKFGHFCKFGSVCDGFNFAKLADVKFHENKTLEKWQILFVVY